MNRTSRPVPTGSPSILKPGIPTSGSHVTLRVGYETVSGTVDEVMPDQTCFWIWTDGGMGRRMIDAHDAQILT